MGSFSDLDDKLYNLSDKIDTTKSLVDKIKTVLYEHLELQDCIMCDEPKKKDTLTLKEKSDLEDVWLSYKFIGTQGLVCSICADRRFSKPIKRKVTKKK